MNRQSLSRTSPSSSSSQTDDDEKGGPALPRGVLPVHWNERGTDDWMDHDVSHTNREASLPTTTTTTTRTNAKTPAAVDLGQFRNVTVGQGYQAKHVIRQPHVVENVKVVDLSRAAANANDVAIDAAPPPQQRKKRVRTDHQSANASHPPSIPQRKDPAKEYLQSEGLRRFRKELDKLLAQR